MNINQVDTNEPVSALPIPAEDLLDLIPVSIAVTGCVEDDSPILYVNRAFEQLTGNTFAEVKGKNPRVLQPSPLPEGQLVARRHLAKIIGERSGGRGRILNRKSDGSVFWSELSIAPLHDGEGEGECVGYVGAQIDVTSRVAVEEQLLQEVHNSIDQQAHLLCRILWIHAKTAAKRSERLHRLALAAAEYWSDVCPRTLELASQLAYVGFIGECDEALNLADRDEALNPMQKSIMAHYPSSGADLIMGLPGLEEAAEAIRWHQADFAPEKKSNEIPSGAEIPKVARVLRILCELDRHVRNFQSLSNAIDLINNEKGKCDPDAIHELRQLLPQLVEKGWPERWETGRIPVSDLMTGMLLNQDLFDHLGRLLACKGQQINVIILERIRDLARCGHIKHEFNVAYRPSSMRKSA